MINKSSRRKKFILFFYLTLLFLFYSGLALADLIGPLGPSQQTKSDGYIIIIAGVIIAAIATLSWFLVTRMKNVAK